MKLEKILGRLSSIEKNAFIKVIDNILSNQPKNGKEIDSGDASVAKHSFGRPLWGAILRIVAKFKVN